MDASWYFADAYYNRERNNYVYPWPNLDYSYSAAIHQEDILNYRKIAIREWVEGSLSETVIVDVMDKSYRRYTDEENSWDKSYEVNNKWAVFYFRYEYSLSMFKLKFSEWIKPVTDEHPRWI